MTGARPTFEVEIGGPNPPTVQRVRLRLSLSGDGFETESLVFDQTQQESGWYFSVDPRPGGPLDGRLVYRPLEPIPDGSYRWRAAAWNGVEWTAVSPTRRLRVDSVPPAEVEGLSLRRDKEAGGLRLEWDPVTMDRNGGAEFVAHYRVYRFVGEGPYRNHTTREIGVSPDPWLVLPPGEEAGGKLLAFRVAAVDQAGNEAGRQR